MKHPFQFGAASLAFAAGIASAWTPGTYPSQMHSRDFTVDTSVRNDVIAFWHGVYAASEGYQNRTGWTGSYSGSNHDANTGTVNPLFVQDVERRLNFFRALTGAPANVAVNTGSTVVISPSDPHKPAASVTKAAAAQRAAYMISRSEYDGSLDSVPDIHDPPASLTGWNSTGWNGAARSNLTYGYFGPGAINAYMSENDAGTSGADNSMVRHRRWSLYQGATDYATGDTPGRYVPSPSSVNPPTNALYVWQKPEEMAAVAPRFVAYPSAGYFPAPLNSRYWSLSYPGANFANASVTMRTQAGAFASITKIAAASNGGPGDASIVWEVGSSAHYGTTAPVDRYYDITVTGITGASVPSTHTYRVILFDPKRFTSDQTLTGSDSAPAAGSANYFFSRPPKAEKVAVDVFNRATTPWTETAENGAPTTIVNRLYTVTDPQATNPYSGYSFTTNAISPLTSINSSPNSRMYRMSHPVRWDIITEGVPDEVFELSREILTVPNSNSTVTFKYKRGYMTVNSRLAVESTQDDGATWTTVGSPVTGKSTSISTLNDTSTQTWSGTLPPSAEPYRIRFRFYRENTNGTNIVIHSENPSAATGIFIDDITTANCHWMELRKSNEIPAGADRFSFSAATASVDGTPLINGSEHLLRMRTLLGNKWFQYGPAQKVTATASPLPGFQGWLAYEYPILTGGFEGDHDGDGIPNAIEFAFHLDPVSPGTSQETVTIDTGLAKAEPEIRISRPVPSLREGIIYGAEWSDTLAPGSWSSAGVTVSFSNGILTAAAPAGPGKRFVRWKISAL